ncbi:MAG: hypothetical protein MUP60_04320, partial [Candidatus Thorarchaeota archaeon]|nr:hypothetical protein [Candidatus Thorarchaeota archaeon]
NHSYYSPYYAQITRDITGSIILRTTSLDYEPIMAVPYSNTMSFNLTYADVDASKSIASGFVNISCGTSVQELQLGVNFWVNYKENGIYQVDIDTTALGAPQRYSLSIIVGSATEWWLSHYTMSVSVTVDYRMVGMDVISPDSASYDDVSHFQFTLTDLDSGDPLTGMTSFFSVLFTMPTGVNSSYVVISDVGAGVYNVSFDTNILNQLSDYQITISFDFGLSPDYWRSVSRSVSGRVIARPTQLSYEVDGSTPYLDNITIALDFEDIGTSVGVSGAAITTTSGSATLVQNLNYWVSEQADGHYVLLIDSTVFGDIGYYTISVSAEYSGDPYFTNKTRLVILEVRERATRLTYTMPQETPYGNNVSFLMRLVDVDDALTGIAGAESYFSLVSVNSTSVDSSYYWITSTTTQGIYHFYLNTSRLTIFGHYTLNITINGMVLSHYQSQIILVEVDVRERNTQLTTAPISQTPYTNNATIIFYVLDKDAHIGVTNTTEGVLFTVNTTISWWVTETSSGTYVMKMNVTQLGSDGQFDFEVIFSWVNDKPFYASRSVKFTITVTGSTSVISYTPTNDIPIGEDIIFSVSYKDSSTGIGISNSSGNIHITLTTLNSTPAGVFQYSLQ